MKADMRSYLFLTVLAIASAVPLHGDHVILLHGLCRTPRSMERMREILEREGYSVSNVGYRSRTASVEQLSETVIGNAFCAARAKGHKTIHFVTHSMGGILVRSYFSKHPEPELGQVVMLGPPNQGSEVVDRFGSSWIFARINGSAGQELGTNADSMPNTLGPVSFRMGVIAGSRSVNWINSLLISGPDDGKVAVERTKVVGMTDHVVIKTTHPMMMRNREVIRQTIYFLRHSKFDHAITRFSRLSNFMTSTSRSFSYAS